MRFSIDSILAASSALFLRFSLIMLMTNLIPDAIDVVAVRAAATATIKVTIVGFFLLAKR